MSDAEKLISIILNDEKLKNSRSFKDKIYRDEPILRTASCLKKTDESKFREMKNLVFTLDYAHRSCEYLFYIQGKFMEDYEDSAVYSDEVIRYYPTYQDFTFEQLHGYFSWRTKVRKGIYEKTSLSFAFLYIYELLNQIGVSSSEDGFIKLKDFRSAYGKIDFRINAYMKDWLTDYVVYYGLDKSLLADTHEVEFDEALTVLLDYKSRSEEDIFSALSALSSYRIENSKFYMEYPEDIRAVSCAVFSALSDYFEKHRANSFCDKLFGKKLDCCYDMFHSAVFYDRFTQNRKYVLNDIHKYSCCNGQWRCEKYYCKRSRNTTLGAIMKTIDCLMRRSLGFRYKLSPAALPKTYMTVIEKEVENYLRKKQEKTAPKIEIDVSKLRGIREAADITREKLIVDEEEPEEETFPAADADDTVPCENGTLLDDTEYRFMQCLLYGGDYGVLVRERRVMLSVLADSVNEKLFDQFGDTVIEFSGETPELIEDYTDELKGMIKP